MGCAIHARPVLGRVTSALYTNRYHILLSGASSLRQECLGALRTSSFTPRALHGPATCRPFSGDHSPPLFRVRRVLG